MAETQAPAQRADAEILVDVESLLQHYPPLTNDRYHIEVDVVSGEVIVRGHVKTVNTCSFFLRSLTRIDGVTGVDSAGLYIDDSIRLAVGQYVPPGISVAVEYGTVNLIGSLPPGADMDAIAAQIGTVPGVERVIATLRA